MNHRKRMDKLIGEKINRWTILEARPGGLKGHVLARCDCGKEVIVRGRSIRTGVSRSCGCLKKDTARKGLRIEGTNPAMNKRFSMYRSRAGLQSIPFEITIEEFEVITSRDCYFCAAKPSNVAKGRTSEYIYNGIDRVDNERGYVQGNVVTCCNMCNTLKGGITRSMVYQLYRYFENA